MLLHEDPKVLHPQAVTVTLLLVAARIQPNRPSLEYATAEVLERYFEEWSDEQKADLYALMAEAVKPEMTMGQMQATVSRCLWNNQNCWAAR